MAKYKSSDKKTITREGIDIHIVTLKKSWLQKQGHRYSKRYKARPPLLFLNNIDPVFCTQFFSFLDLIFLKFQTRKNIRLTL
jgi:hypothetical protein